MRSRTVLACFTTSSPATSARPRSGLVSVVRMRTAVVLPAPLGPRTPRTLPSSAIRSKPSRAWILPYALYSPSVRMADVFAIGHFLPMRVYVLQHFLKFVVECCLKEAYSKRQPGARSKFPRMLHMQHRSKNDARPC